MNFSEFSFKYFEIHVQQNVNNIKHLTVKNKINAVIEYSYKKYKVIIYT